MFIREILSQNLLIILKKRRKKDSVYPFAVFNTDRSEKPGTHWRSFLNIEPKSELFLFDSKGFKYFIVDNDYPTINKLLCNLKKFNKKDNEINLVSLKFSPEIYHKLKRNELSKLTEKARDFFHLLAEFAEVNNLTNEMTIMMDDKVQELY